MEEARDQVACLVGAEAKNVTFTSGATEANTLALTPGFEIGGRKEPRDRLFVSAIEHPSVRSGGRFAAGQVEELPVTSSGVCDLAALKTALKKAERPLVSVMLANNETGVVQPISEIAEIVHAESGVLHGATTSAPDKALKFYLMSRGISEAEAEALLIQAFIGEVIEEISNESVREALMFAALKWLGTRQ